MIEINEYQTHAISEDLLSLHNVDQAGDVVKAEVWVELWKLVFHTLNDHDEKFAYVYDKLAELASELERYVTRLERVEDLYDSLNTQWLDLNATWTQLQNSYNIIAGRQEDIDQKYQALNDSFIHYGKTAPTNEHIKLWVVPTRFPLAPLSVSMLRSELLNSIGWSEDIVELDISEITKEGAYSTSGTFVQREIARCTDKIPVAVDDVYLITGGYNCIGVLVVAYNNDEVVETFPTLQKGYTAAVVKMGTETYTVKPGTTHLVFSSYRVSATEPFKVEKLQVTPKPVRETASEVTREAIANLDVPQFKEDMQSFEHRTEDDLNYLIAASKTEPKENTTLEHMCDNGGLNATAVDLLIQILTEANYTEDVSSKLDALKAALSLDREAAPALRLPNKLTAGTYTLRYEDTHGATNSFVDICSFTISQNATPVYDKFITLNTAPKGATAIGVYNASNTKVGEIVLGALGVKPNYGRKLYSFAAFSDVHIGDHKNAEYYEKRANGEAVDPDPYLEKFENTMQAIDSDEDISFTVICGDMVDRAEETMQLEDYKSVVYNLNKPVYVTMGNHESINAINNVDEPFKYLFGDAENEGYFEQKKYPEINKSLYFSFSPEGTDDVFIMFGISGVYSTYTALSIEQLQWLQDTLEANKDKRCFLFHHYFPYDGSGDAVNCYSQNGLQGFRGDSFYDILKHYSNVIYFHGHTHAKFKVQELHPMNTIDTVFGRYSINIPSLTCPTYPNAAMNDYSEDKDASEGYIVDVYENGIILNGKDFITNRFAPLGCYCLDTTIQPVSENTFNDRYGFTKNAFKECGTWYTPPSAADASTITKISFVEHYMDAYDECWNPTASDNSGVLVYRKNTELFIACAGQRVRANANCSHMFAGFNNLSEISGLWKLDMTNVTSIESMFEGCAALKTLALQNFDTATPDTMRSVFKGCSSLTKLDLSVFNTKKVADFQNMCSGCASLQSVVLPEIIPQFSYIYGVLQPRRSYLNAAFKDCASLQKLDLSRVAWAVEYSGTFSGCRALTEVKFNNTVQPYTMANMFQDCASLTDIDLSKFDFAEVDSLVRAFKGCTALNEVTFPTTLDLNKVKDFYECFANCPNLILDCSNWVTDATARMDYFNRGSEGVTLPIQLA